MISGCETPLRYAVEVGVQLVVGLDDRVFFLRPHVEAHHQHAHAGLRNGVHVLHARHLAQQPLHGNAGALLDFGGRGARHLHEDVEHGHDDLRLFFARRLPDGEGAQQQRGRHEQRRQLRVDEVRSNRARDPHWGFGLGHYFASTCLPLNSRSPGWATTWSPACSPESTSTCCAEGCPA